jgi:hypothetical protein
VPAWDTGIFLISPASGPFTGWILCHGTCSTAVTAIREVIESVFTDEQGRPTLRIERYKRSSDTSQWIIKDVWFANRTASTAEKVEENIRYLKLIFPVKEGDEWNGNIYNTLDEWNYEVLEADAPYQAEFFLFDSAATVLQADAPTMIGRDYALEVYACGVGMVYKKFIHQHFQMSPFKIIDGEDYSYTILSWGM